MHCKSFLMQSYGLFIFILQKSASTKQHDTKMHPGDSISKIEANIETYNRHYRTGSSLQLTAFHLTKRDITERNFFRLKETLYGKTPYRKKLTVMTIKKFNEDEPYGSSSTMANFITGIRQHLENKKVRSIRVGNLVLTIERIKEDQIPDFGMLSTTCDMIKGIYNEINNLLIESFAYILCHSFKHHMHVELYYVARRLIHHNLPTDDAGQAKYRNTLGTIFDEKYHEIIAKLKKSFVFSKKRRYKIHEIHRYYQVRKKIIMGIAAYEKRHNFHYFRDREYMLEKAINLVAMNFHRETLISNLSEIIPTGLELVERPENKAALKDAFISSGNIMIQIVKNNRGYEDGSITVYDDSESNNGFFRWQRDRSYLMAKFSMEYVKYFERIQLNQHIEETLKPTKPKFDYLCTEFDPHISTKVIINFRLTDFNLPAVCCMLNRAKIAEKLKENQKIIINNKKPITAEKMNLGASKYANKVFDLTNGAQYYVSEDETFDVYTTKDAGQDPRYDAVKMSFHAHLQLGRDKDSSMPCHENNVHAASANEHCKKTRRKEKIEKYHDDLFTKCLKHNKSEFNSLHQIAAVDNTIETDVYIMCHTKRSNKIKIMSAIFDIQKTNKLDGDAQKLVTRKIKCIDNILLSFLTDFIKSLQIKQHVNAAKFEMVDTWSLKSRQYIHMKSVHAYNHDIHKPGYLYSNIIRYYKSRGMDCKSKIIKITDLLESVKHKKLEMFLKRLNLERVDVRDIICKHILNISPATDEIGNHHVFDDHRILEPVKFYAVNCDDNTSILHVCIVRDYDVVDAIFSDPIKILANLLENKEAKLVIDSFSEIEVYMNLDVRIVTIVIDDMCKLYYFDPYMVESEATTASYSKSFLERHVDIFEKHIESKYMQSSKNDNCSPKALGYTIFKGLIEERIEELVTFIFAEKEKLLRDKEISFYSFKITNNKIVDEVVDREGASISVEYEDFEHLDMRKVLSI